MKISIEEINKDLEEEILIRCHEVDDEICEVVNKLKTESLVKSKLTGTIRGPFF